MARKYVKKYSDEVGLDIGKEAERRFGHRYPLFLERALEELYKHDTMCVLHNKEGITNKLSGDFVNFFGALSEICVAGIFAPFIKEHNSPDLTMVIDNVEMHTEIMNRISQRRIDNPEDWEKDFKTTIDRIREKKEGSPNFIFVMVLKRASEPKKEVWNRPRVSMSRSLSIRGELVESELDSTINGIFFCDILPCSINKAESRIASTCLAYRFVDVFKCRLIETFLPEELKPESRRIAYVADEITRNAVPIE